MCKGHAAGRATCARNASDQASASTTAKGASASSAAGRASASTTAKEAGGSNAAGRASASTTAKEAGARNEAGRSSSSTTVPQPQKKPEQAMRRDEHLRAQPPKTQLQGMRRVRHLRPAPQGGKKQTFPKANPPPQKDSKPFKTTLGRTKKDGSNTSSKTIRIRTPSLPNCTPPSHQPPPQKPLTSLYENPAAGRSSANT